MGMGPGMPARPPASAQTSDGMGRSNSKEPGPWRPSFKESWRIPERRYSAEHRHSLERRGNSTTRRTSTERRYSQSPSRPRAKSVGPREARTMGSIRLDCDAQQQAQPSEWWQQSLPSGDNVQVHLVADSNSLAQAAHRLNLQGPGSLTAIDFQGVNLRAAAGRLCLIQVAFRDGSGLQCILFDIMQLGAHIQALIPFLQNPDANKIVYDAQMHATVLAHKFGITLAGVIDVHCAFQVLNGYPTASLPDFLEWCGVAHAFAKAEASKMEKSPQLWAHRPLPGNMLTYAVQGICMLHAIVPGFWPKLYAFGPGTHEMVKSVSQQQVQMAAAAGWSCRQAGLWIGEHEVPPGGSPPGAAGPGREQAAPRPDPELDDWLARRFGGGEAAPSRGGTQREPSQEPATPLAALSGGAVRAEDSPRTASWRAAVAQQSQSKDRPRSSSPSLTNWLAKRSEVKADAPTQKPRKSPPPRDTDDKTRKPDKEAHKFEGPFDIGLQQFISLNEDRKAWAEILDEEGAHTGDSPNTAQAGRASPT